MSPDNIRIVELNPGKVASFYSFGPEPEMKAWEALTAWAKPRGYLDEAPGKHRIFGFNNPDPDPGSPNYGYEFWITLPESTGPTPGAEIKLFSGGMYAILRCEALEQSPYEVIPTAWKRLVTWVETQPYQMAGHQWLEEHLRPELISRGQLVLDLYLPIAR